MEGERIGKAVELQGIDASDNAEHVQACAYNELDLVREFVEKDEKCVDAPDEQGYSALQWAALNNRVAVISYLLEHGADVNRCPRHPCPQGPRSDKFRPQLPRFNKFEMT